MGGACEPSFSRWLEAPCRPSLPVKLLFLNLIKVTRSRNRLFSFINDSFIRTWYKKVRLMWNRRPFSPLNASKKQNLRWHIQDKHVLHELAAAASSQPQTSTSPRLHARPGAHKPPTTPNQLRFCYLIKEYKMFCSNVASCIKIDLFQHSFSRRV